jgi:cation transport ATPase
VHSNHPLSVAITQKAKIMNESFFEIAEFEEVAGKGLKGKL